MRGDNPRRSIGVPGVIQILFSRIFKNYRYRQYSATRRVREGLAVPIYGP